MFPLARFRIEDSSMEPALKTGDYVLVNKLSKRFSAGDIVVFKHGEKFLVKRVEKISGDKFFAVGDNFSESKDSRYFGPVGKNAVVGKMFFRLKS